MSVAFPVQDIIRSIIQHQEIIIGPIAFEQANKVSGLKVIDEGDLKVEVSSKELNTVVTQLVKKYEELFGQASVEVCKDAVKELHPPIPSEQLPEILK